MGLCYVGRGTIVNSLQTVDVSILEIHLDCSVKNADDLKIKAML